MKLKKLSKSDLHKIIGNKDVHQQNQNHIILGFYEFLFSPDEITKSLMLEPLSTGIKGEKYSITKKQPFNKIREYNHWDYEWKLQTNEFIGDIVERFIEEIIVPRKRIIKKLSSTSEIQLQIVQYYYDGHNPGIHIKSEHTKVLSEINCSIDIDLYCLCKDDE